MKILHTSDWHLGRSLYGRKRYEEFSAFLDWLAFSIESEGVDLLLVAGDVFDTGTPGNRAQELYYRFLCKVAGSCCQHIVIIAGNHDSPSFLNAPKELLRALNVHVVGAMTDDANGEVLVLRKEPRIETNGGQPVTEKNPYMEVGKEVAIICAVPYLRDRDVRTAEPGETIEDKNRKLVEGIRNHYAEVVNLAENKRKNLRESASYSDKYIPIIATGHLFTAGGKTMDGDGVRELYVGSLARVGTEIFPEAIDYVALGHLHVPQAVGKSDHIRYSGSPIPVGFGEAIQQKSVVIIEFNPPAKPRMDTNKHESKKISENLCELRIDIKPIPCFQELVRLVGSLDYLLERLEDLKEKKSSAWLEIEYTGKEIRPDLRESLEETIADSDMEILRIRNLRTFDKAIRSVREKETLDDMSVNDVFARCMDAYDIPDDEREELKVAYNEIVHSIYEEDKNEE